MIRESFRKHWYSFLLGMIILLGGMLRLKGLLINPSITHDESNLALGLNFNTTLDFFKVTSVNQIAPPFFMAITKLIANILGHSIIAIRILPFIASVLSIILFYPLASKTLKVESTVLWAVFFFAINQSLINSSFKFMPYSFDVFFTIVCLLFFLKLDMEKLTKTKAIIYGILLAMIPWFSFASVFIIIGGFLNLVIKFEKPYFNDSKIKDKFILIMPMIISLLLFTATYLFEGIVQMNKTNYLQNYVLSLNPLVSLSIFNEGVKYLFFPIKYVICALVLFVWGVIIYFKKQKIFFNISLLSLALLILASYLHIYPFYKNFIVFLVPILLLLMIKPLDLATFDKKLKLFLIILLIFFTLCPQIKYANHFIKHKKINMFENIQ